ncbi:hypothetical protein [Lysinibacillus xylanilyticus]|uniref:hypothetical protein n=1 Tax=Lysinibacillus xylanilyticus TaxID=582475 RepID=UPI003D0342DF
MKFVDIAKYIVKEPLILFKVDEAFKYFSYISKENKESIVLKRNYLFTNYLANVCNEIGFDGIYYKGAGDKNYYNIAIFEKAISKLVSHTDIETLSFKTVYNIGL